MRAQSCRIADAVLRVWSAGFGGVGYVAKGCVVAAQRIDIMPGCLETGTRRGCIRDRKRALLSDLALRSVELRVGDADLSHILS